jgi:hypothetical protein
MGNRSRWTLSHAGATEGDACCFTDCPAIEILYMRLSSGQGRLSPDEFVEIGCELMRRLNAKGGTDSNLAYRLQIIGTHCLLGNKGAATVREVCTNLKRRRLQIPSVRVRPPRAITGFFQHPTSRRPTSSMRRR